MSMGVISGFREAAHGGRFPLLILGLLLIGPVGSGFGASEKGEYAVKDAGRATCERFVAARDKKAEAYYLFLGWMSGYLSSYNRYADDTVDIVPWQNTELLAALIENHCRNNPKMAFATSVDNLIAALVPMRLREISETVQASHKDKSINIYRDVLRRAQVRLKELGHYAGVVDGLYGGQTRAAIERYQREQEIPVSGLPDQLTLYKLFNQS